MRLVEYILIILTEKTPPPRCPHEAPNRPMTVARGGGQCPGVRQPRGEPMTSEKSHAAEGPIHHNNIIILLLSRYYYNSTTVCVSS